MHGVLEDGWSEVLINTQKDASQGNAISLLGLLVSASLHHWPQSS